MVDRTVEHIHRPSISDANFLRFMLDSVVLLTFHVFGDILVGILPRTSHEKDLTQEGAIDR